jgi:hypothetical protein
MWQMKSGNESIFIKSVSADSKNEPDSCLAGHSAKMHDFSFHSERFCQQSIHTLSKEVLGVEALHRWHHIDDVKSVNSQITVNMTFFLPIILPALVGTSSRSTVHCVECWYSNPNQFSFPGINIRNESSSLVSKIGRSHRQNLSR